MLNKLAARQDIAFSSFFNSELAKPLENVCWWLQFGVPAIFARLVHPLDNTAVTDRHDISTTALCEGF